VLGGLDRKVFSSISVGSNGPRTSDELLVLTTLAEHYEHVRIAAILARIARSR
jgi:hypothetical protein